MISRPAPPLRFESLAGDAIAGQLDALAAVRIAVFRDWPYLYEGSLDYERKYLDVYLRSPRSLAILVWDDDRCVGASTALPLTDAEAEAREPFERAGHDISRIDYFGESVLLPAYRGLGLGVRFFDRREAHARALGFTTCAFCAVARPDDHPARPAGYVPNDAFWQRRGYRRDDSLVARYRWTDIGDTTESAKPLVFWLRRLPEEA